MDTALRFCCPHCSRVLKASGDLHGKAARCPSCRTVLVVPSAVPPAKSKGTSGLLAVCLVLSALVPPLACATSSAFMGYRSFRDRDDYLRGAFDRDLHNPMLRDSTRDRIEGGKRLVRQLEGIGLDGGACAFLAMTLALILFAVGTADCLLSVMGLRRKGSRVFYGTLTVGVLGILWAVPGSCCCIGLR